MTVILNIFCATCPTTGLALPPGECARSAAAPVCPRRDRAPPEAGAGPRPGRGAAAPSGRCSPRGTGKSGYMH